MHDSVNRRVDDPMESVAPDDDIMSMISGGVTKMSDYAKELLLLILKPYVKVPPNRMYS